MTKFEDTSSVQEDTTAHQRSRLLERVAAIKADASAHAASTTTVDAVAAVRRDLLGKSGSLLVLRRELGGLEESVRREAGAAIAAAQRELTALLDAKELSLRTNEHALVHPLDVTVPGLAPEAGTLHPTTQMMYDLNDAFSALNFAVYEGPEVSSELFEFDKMNFPEGHPARESMDTYWVSGTENQHGARRLCLRPHLTGASIRYMRENEPPYRFVYPGRVYRNESTDARHERAFYQYEVLIVDEVVPLTTARFLVDTILDTVFGEPVRTRMRAGFFPFVEPGFEVDMQCRVCGGVGCRTCGQVGWLEVMPGGSPHPNVLAAAGLDPERWSGCYVNVGLDRLVMMRYGIDDVRLMHGGDLRFLDQFA